ncbi:hypothetical protein RFI_29563 [Reticulomyxa filosa]|uniref:Transmembrane protein n=1 Tax=Reticulomyxa filosa TaxID=46433 RepID=X6M2Y7_RETFI|nr:hypothetical protein RFI_29563 [Reticulomyxa filosa]|eukprot:ETO07827.1 hypothetical protein RFI_29563 [Reticulomyxa filosa]
MQNSFLFHLVRHCDNILIFAKFNFFLKITFNNILKWIFLFYFDKVNISMIFLYIQSLLFFSLMLTFYFDVLNYQINFILSDKGCCHCNQIVINMKIQNKMSTNAFEEKQWKINCISKNAPFIYCFFIQKKLGDILKCTNMKKISK